MRRQVDPAHVAGLRSLAELARQLGERRSAFRQLDEVGRDLADGVERFARGVARPGELGQRVEKLAPLGALAPAQFQRSAHFAHRAGARHPQVARRTVAQRGEILPRRQTARLLQAGAEHVAGEVDHLAAAERRAEELHTGFGELMGLVEHRHLDTRQQLGDAAVAQAHVGEEEVMVDDHQVREHRLAPRLHHMALAVFGALGAEAVFARRGHQRNHAAAFVEAVDLGEVPARRCLRPLLDLRERAHGPAVGQLRRLARLVQAVQAEVACAAFQQRDADRQLQGLTQARQVAQKELVLQALGGSADQRARPREQGRHQVGECLADAGTGFGDESAPLVDRRRDGHRHSDLYLALDIAIVGLCQRPPWPERMRNRLAQCARGLPFGTHAGSGGSSSASMCAI